MLLLHDNVTMHTDALSKPPQQLIIVIKLSFLFSKLKLDLTGKQFHNDDEIKQDVYDHFDHNEYF